MYISRSSSIIYVYSRRMRPTSSASRAGTGTGTRLAKNEPELARWLIDIYTDTCTYLDLHLLYMYIVAA